MATPILDALRSGGVLKVGLHSRRFFLVQRSAELPVDQGEAKRLYEAGHVRHTGKDSHGNLVLSISNTAPPATNKG